MNELKMTPNKKKEVIRDCLDNLGYLEVRRLVIELVNTNNINKEVVYELLWKNHREVLVNSLLENEVIED